MADKIFLTKEWLQKLQDELKYLKEVERVKVAERLKEAISFWDLSENAEYEEARNVQAQVELRISELEEQLKNVEIIDESKKDTSKVGMWDTVVIEELESGTKEELTLVGTTETDVLAKPMKISNESPVGKAIMWKKKGSIVKVKSNAWVKEYKILDIK